MAKHRAKTKREKRGIKNPNNVIFIRVQKDLIKINLKDILAVDAISNDAIIDIGSKKYAIAITLRALMKKLPENDFIRIQKSCIVRIDKISAIEDHVCIINNKKVAVSRRFRARLISKLTSPKKDKRENPDDLVFIRVQHDLIKINLRDITLINAVSNYAVIHIGRKKYVLASTLEKLLSKLPKNDFVRIHKSYAVRIDKIDKIKNNICFVDKRKLPIARRMRTAVRSRLIIIESSKT